MRRWTFLVAVLAAAMVGACGGSSGGTDPGTDPGTDGTVDDVVGDTPADALPDAPPGDTVVEDLPEEVPPTDTDEDVPSGPLIPKEEGDKLTVSNGVVTLVYDLAKGTFDLGVVPGQDGLINAHSEAVLTVQGAETTIASSDPGPRIQYQSVFGPDELGEAVVIRFDAVPTNKIGGVATYIALHRTTPAVTFRTIVAMPFANDVQVQEIRPVVADFEDGAALHLGPGTRDAVVVDNGSEILLDFKADAQLVGENPGGTVGPGLASNWSAVVCTAAKSCAVAGFVTTTKAIGLVTTDQRSGSAVTVGGEEGLSLFSIRSHFQPYANLDVGRTQSSDVAYVDLTNSSYEGLKRFGRAIATINNRQPPAVPPSSWNSWGGGGGSGGAGQGIDETFILQNLEAATRDFLPYGMDYFLIDDGWQKDDGTWTTDTAKFPKHGAQDGMAWMADQITAAGFLPGMWAAPFRVGKDWPIATQHPDWLLTLDAFGTMALGATSNYAMLDPSNPAVKAYLTEIYTRVTKDWGYRFLKLDFSVYAMFGTNYSVAGRSGLSLYKEALQVIRDAIGPDVVLMIVSGTGANYGIADAQRLSLDNMPRWGSTMSPFDQGIRATVLSASHRYWMGNTVWSNNPDLVFFRDDQGLTADEAHAFALFVSVFGGIVKLGESFTYLATHPEALSLVERMVPPLTTFPEPLDLFQKRWPELWRVPMADLGLNCNVYGLFHWGENRNIVAQQDVDESARTLTIPAIVDATSGGPRVFFDLEEGTVLTDPDGKALRTGDVDVTMPPRTGRLLLARAVPSFGGVGPVFLATDRHLMGGGGVLTETAEDANSTTIAFTKAVPGRVTTMSFLVATGAQTEVQVLDATDVTHETTPLADADLLTVTFTTTTATAGLRVNYLAQ
jgi:hypothetical protein